ncbi:MAG TPA: hypothetical protein VEW68_05415 [Patescibacteria group bacterium]|nr:hypothetical protein [Patescibacteria group bacterium]
MQTSWILGAVGLVYTLVHGFFAWRSGKLTDADRAGLLTQLADEAAAFVVATWPNKSWAELVAEIIKRLSATPGLPTGNSQAIQNAATAALVRLKGAPPAK